MNEENFTDYLKKVSNLYKISYEELKTLVYQYPYCQNLHQLLVEKSKLEEHEHYDQNLARASTYTNDRPHLYRKLQQIQELEKAEESILAHDEYLELPNLKELGTPLPALPADAEESAKRPLALDFTEEQAPAVSGTEIPDVLLPEEAEDPYTAADKHPAEHQPTETVSFVEQAPLAPVDDGADTSEPNTGASRVRTMPSTTPFESTTETVTRAWLPSGLRIWARAWLATPSASSRMTRTSSAVSAEASVPACGGNRFWSAASTNTNASRPGNIISAAPRTPDGAVPNTVPWWIVPSV